MKIHLLNEDSALLARAVIRLDDWTDPEELQHAEKEIRAGHCRAYLYTSVPATNSSLIHRLEEQGYQFSEFRIKSLYKADGTAESTRTLYPWRADLIGDDELFAKAQALLTATAGDDRFACDETLPASFSQSRNHSHLLKSYKSWPDEFLLGVVHAQTNELIAFRSGAFLSKTEAHYYQYAVSPDLDFTHTAGMLDAFAVEFLQNRGIQFIHAVSTGFNIAELNRLILQSGFRIVSSDVIMRKVF